MSAKFNGMKVFCYNANALVGGELVKVGPEGCEFLCHSMQAVPPFARKCSVRLDLFEPQSGFSQSLEARIVDYGRRRGVWVYRIRWRSFPELLEHTVRNEIH